MSSLGRGLEQTSARFVFDASGDDLMRILSELTQDVERFDSMIRNQRDLLRQHGIHPGAFEERLIRLKSKRISADAAEIATRARSALDGLRGLAHAGELESRIGGPKMNQPIN
jgi:hypothetical protein